MPRLLAILSLSALAAGCGPSFYDRCLLGVWQREALKEPLFSAPTIGAMLAPAEPSSEALAAGRYDRLVGAGFSEKEAQEYVSSLSDEELRERGVSPSKDDESKNAARMLMRQVEAFCEELDARRRAR
jgi:hypothetical protein